MVSFILGFYLSLRKVIEQSAFVKLPPGNEPGTIYCRKERSRSHIPIMRHGFLNRKTQGLFKDRLLLTITAIGYLTMSKDYLKLRKMAHTSTVVSEDLN